MPQSPASLHTAICDLLGCTYPVLLAGMGGVARSELVSAVTRAGGFGFLGMVRESPELIRAEIASLRAHTDRDFGVNLIPAATAPDLLRSEIQACIQEKVPVMALFWDRTEETIKLLRDAGMIVICQIGSAAEAEAAQKAGAHALIAQGVEAGGHVRGTTALAPLLDAVRATSDLPVLACGGLSSGADLVQALSHGADGIVLGTAFLATNESFAHAYHKQRIIEAGPDSTAHTDMFHINWPKGAFVRVLKNSTTQRPRAEAFAEQPIEIGREDNRPIYRFSTDSPLRNMTGDFEAMALYAGMGSAAINDIPSAAQRLLSIVTSARSLLSTDRSEPIPHENQTNLCFAAAADDTYMGYASRDEILTLLNLLLEGERAGARICARSSAEAFDPELKTLLRQIWQDEATSCAILIKGIKALNGEASPNISDFYDRCLAFDNITDRISYINRGQVWVARKLSALLPRLRNDELHKDLKQMLDMHEANTALVQARLDQRS